MTLPIDSLSWIRLVSVASTPAEWQVYANRVIGLTAATTVNLGSGPDSPGTVLGISGYPITAGAQEPLPAVHTWFVMTRLDAVTNNYLSTVRAWSKPAQLTAVQAAAQALWVNGTAAADIRTAFGAVINAVVADMTP